MTRVVRLSGPRILLREFTPTDHADLYSICSDPAPTENLSF